MLLSSPGGHYPTTTNQILHCVQDDKQPVFKISASLDYLNPQIMRVSVTKINPTCHPERSEGFETNLIKFSPVLRVAFSAIFSVLKIINDCCPEFPNSGLGQQTKLLINDQSYA